MASVRHSRKWLALCAAAALLSAGTAAAQGSNWRGAPRHPAPHPSPHPPPDHWPHGHWHHGDYSGHIGWWWVVGPSWYLYDEPIYPYWYREPPVDVIVERLPAPSGPPPAASWYWCEGAQAYYPYVAECPGGWTPVAAASAPPGTKEDTK